MHFLSSCLDHLAGLLRLATGLEAFSAARKRGVIAIIEVCAALAGRECKPHWSGDSAESCFSHPQEN